MDSNLSVSSLQPSAHVPLSAAAADHAETLERAGLRVIRYGLVVLLLLWGVMKFMDFEAQGIRELVGNHPLMSWMYPAFGVRGASAIIGVIEIGAAVMMGARRWSPRVSAVGSAIAAFTFIVTLSFLVTTPHALAVDNPIGGFLMKDLILLGGALLTAGEALRAHRRGGAHKSERTL